MVTGRALVVLACAALFGFHTAAHAQTEIWSAALTVEQHSSAGFVFRGYDASRHSGSLSDDRFEHNGITYTVLNLVLAVDGPLWFGTDVAGAAALGNHNRGMVLEVGGTGLFLEEHQYGLGTHHQWADPGLSWDVGDVIHVRLTVDHAPIAPILPPVTAAVPEPGVFSSSSSRGSVSVDLSRRPRQRFEVNDDVLTP